LRPNRPWTEAALLGVAAGATTLVPKPQRLDPVSAAEPVAPAGVMTLLRLPQFRRVMLVSGLVLSRHAMHDTFAVIRWSDAGVTPAIASALWSESVAAEVIVFFLIGPPLLSRPQSAGVLAIAAMAGVVLWAAMASSTRVIALAVVQPLHGPPSRRSIWPACASLRRSSLNASPRRPRRCMRSGPARRPRS
jgi:PPP family 3-phenylpropionic acid transporter